VERFDSRDSHRAERDEKSLGYRLFGAIVDDDRTLIGGARLARFDLRGTALPLWLDGFV